MRPNNSYQTRVEVSQGKRKSSTSKRVGTTTSTGKATQTIYRKKKPVGKMVLFGAMSVCAYLFLFSNETLVTQTFTLGGWHAAFPVLTAFFFSFVHGAFASNLLSVIGLEAKK
jgi:uncharacterized integral membrane protein